MNDLMTTEGLIFMIFAWSGVTGMMLYSVIKIMKGKRKFHEEED